MSDTHKLYGDSVEMVFDPNATRYRYTVTDHARGIKNKATRGVTSVLGDVLDKPGLRTWPMNMSNQVLFGMKFDEVTKEYVHDWDEALIKPDTLHTAEELHEAFLSGSREWTKRSDKGKDIGTHTHASVEAYLLGKDYIVPEEVPKENKQAIAKALDCFIDFWESIPNKEVISVERPIYSRSLQYAGTFDLLARINGKTYMLDVKTTNASKEAPLGIYSEMFIQLGAYSYAIREETGIEIDDCGILRLGKDGRLNIALASDIGVSREDCERAFAFAVRLHDWLETISPFLKDAHFKSSLVESSKVDEDVVSNKEVTNGI